MAYLFPSYAPSCGPCGGGRTCTPSVAAYSVISATGTFTAADLGGGLVLATNGQDYIELDGSYVRSTVVAIRIDLGPTLGYEAGTNVIDKVYSLGYNVANVKPTNSTANTGSGSKTYLSNVFTFVSGLTKVGGGSIAGGDVFTAPVEVVVLNQKRINQ